MPLAPARPDRAAEPMRLLLAAAALSLAACTGADRAPDPANQADPAPPGADAAGWDLAASGEGTALVLASASGERTLSFFCPAARDELLVNVPSFRPVGSEERMTFGSGGEVATLVADTSGDSLRGGVSGTGAVPANLSALLAGPVAVNHGAQNSGPHSAPPPDLVSGFVAACRDGGEPPSAPPPPPRPAGDAPDRPSGPVGACRLQDGERLRNPPMRAIGTEPFWNALTEGRCVTYSHPEDIDGTRIWTAYRPGPDGSGTWSGALEGRLFELAIRSRPGCSDGMSDKRYAWEAELKVHGEVRRGCAEPR